jgi:hypothetical protein
MCTVAAIPDHHDAGVADHVEQRVVPAEVAFSQGMRMLLDKGCELSVSVGELHLHAGALHGSFNQEWTPSQEKYCVLWQVRRRG